MQSQFLEYRLSVETLSAIELFDRFANLLFEPRLKAFAICLSFKQSAQGFADDLTGGPIEPLLHIFGDVTAGWAAAVGDRAAGG